MSEAGSDLDKAAELVGTVKQLLKVMETRSAELVNEQKADLIFISAGHDLCRFALAR